MGKGRGLRAARAAALAATVGLMALIFVLSAQPGVASYELSGQIAQKVQAAGGAAKAATPVLFSPDANANMRKWAHVYLYCALGVSTAATVHLFWGAARPRPKRYWLKAALVAAALCTVYACTDEIHQLFIPDRAGMIEDVGVDALGFLPCAALTCLLWQAWERLRAKKHDKK